MAQSFCHTRLSFFVNESISLPSIKIDPLVASVRRFIILSNVDFPAPDLPMIPIISGLLISNVTSFTARLSPKYLFNFSTLIISMNKSNTKKLNQSCIFITDILQFITIMLQLKLLT